MKKALFILLGGVMLFGLLGCGSFGKKYKVDYHGNEGMFINAKDTYRAGLPVKLKTALGTDTDYSLYVDGEAVDQHVSSDGTMLIFSFIMPDHDISVSFNAHNSMVNTIEEESSEEESSAVSDDVKANILGDYYEAPASVDGPAAYLEMTLNRGASGQLYLNVYEGTTAKDNEEIHTVYAVPDEALDRFMDVVRETKMEKWNDRDGVCLDGKTYVVKFYGEKSGEWTRVSTDNMPEDGKESIGQVKEVLISYCLDEYLVQADQ